jgi:hypothetical protein
VDPTTLLVRFAAVGVPVGLAVGLGLGLVARREDGWGGYAGLRRRAARLGHVAAVMLPALGGLYGLLLASRPHAASLAEAGAWLWVAGGTLLPLALFWAAWKPRHLVALVAPALVVFTASAVLGAALWGGLP